MAKVFVVQETMRKNDKGDMVPVINFAPALEYGDLSVCLKPGRIGLSPGPMVEQLKRVLKNFSDDDFLVPVGDPAAIAAASIICAFNNRGRVNMLKWDKNSRRYILVAIDIN